MSGVQTDPIGIYTICYQPGMEHEIDPAFLPYDVTADPQPDRRETAHMLRFWQQGLHRRHQVSGLLSPKFRQKTGFSGELYKAFVAANPGFDVWFINPYPNNHYLSFNLWEQGEIWHPGLCERSLQVFKAGGLSIDPGNFPRSTRNTLLFCNYWVGTEAFWDQFMPFVRHVSEAAETIESISQPTFYTSGATSFWPFMFERLFTTFLVMRPDIRAGYVRHEPSHMLQMCSNKLESMLIRDWAPIIDQWDAAGTYSADQRAVFRSLLRLGIFGQFENYPFVLQAVLGL